MLAISVDHIFAHNVFAASLGTLPYPLLSDWHKETARKYDVFNDKDLVARRSVFVVGKDGNLKYQNTEFGAGTAEHYERTMEELRRLKAEE